MVSHAGAQCVYSSLQDRHDPVVESTGGCNQGGGGLAAGYAKLEALDHGEGSNLNHSHASTRAVCKNTVQQLSLLN